MLNDSRRRIRDFDYNHVGEHVFASPVIYIFIYNIIGEWISADELVSLLDEQEWRHYLEQEVCYISVF